MATNIVLNGVVYAIPAIGEESWGQSLSDFFIAIPQGLLQKSGGTFTLTADVNFGANFGILAKYLTSRGVSPATIGLLRLNLTDVIAWRNNANSANLSLGINGSDQLTFGGTAIQPSGNYITALTGDVVAAGPGSAASTIQPGVVDNSKISNSAAIAYSKLALTGAILNADLAGSIADSKLSTIATAGKVSDSATSAVSAATASVIMKRDANANSRLNNLIEGFTTTATAAGTTTLTVASTYAQQFTGVTTQTVVLPDCTTLVIGQAFIILNRSSGIVTVNANGGGLVQAVAASSQALVTCTNIGTAAGAWDSNYSAPSGSGTVTSVAMTVPTFLSIGGSPVTTTGTLALTLSGTALPVANGGTAQTAVISAPAATTWAGWDANKNLSGNSIISGYATTATAAGTTTLVVGSSFQQYFTGVTTQTVKLPVTSTLVLGQQFQITNNSTGKVTVQSSGANSILVMAGSTVATFTCILVTGTTAASWSLAVAATNFVPNFQTSTAISTLATAVTSASYVTFSNSPALTFTPTVTGTYKVYCVGTFEADGAATNSQVKVINTTGAGTLLSESGTTLYQAATGSSMIMPGYIQSVYTLTAGVSYVFDIQGRTASGSLYLNGGNQSFYMHAERVA